MDSRWKRKALSRWSSVLCVMRLPSLLQKKFKKNKLDKDHLWHSLTVVDWTLVPTSRCRTVADRCFLAEPQILQTEYSKFLWRTEEGGVVVRCRNARRPPRTTRSLGAGRSNLSTPKVPSSIPGYSTNSQCGWRRGIVARMLVSANKLLLSCARLVVGWVTTLSATSQLSLSSLWGR